MEFTPRHAELFASPGDQADFKTFMDTYRAVRVSILQLNSLQANELICIHQRGELIHQVQAYMHIWDIFYP